MNCETANGGLERVVAGIIAVAAGKGQKVAPIPTSRKKRSLVSPHVI